MKNKLSLIDINVVSTYTGRFFTVIVAVLVLIITVSALFSDGGIRDHKRLVLSVPGGRFEPLRRALAMETGRSVRIAGKSEHAELHLLPLEAFVLEGSRQGFVGLFSFCRMPRGRDKAVLIARADRPRVSFDTLETEDVVFDGNRSVNGFKIQVELLESLGVGLPRSLAGLRFTEARDGGGRVVMEVLAGKYAIGACRRSDVVRLVESGAVESDEIVIVESAPALPETLVACERPDSAYYYSVFASLAAKLQEPSPRKDGGTTSALSRCGVRSMWPVTEEERKRAERLIARWDTRTP